MQFFFFFFFSSRRRHTRSLRDWSSDVCSSDLLDAAGPYGRGFDGAGVDVVLLCVPDGEIAAAAAAVEIGPLVGHCSGATGLDVLAPHEAFGLHPLMTVTEAGADFAGAGCAVAGTTARALGVARRLA